MRIIGLLSLLLLGGCFLHPLTSVEPTIEPAPPPTSDGWDIVQTGLSTRMYRVQNTLLRAIRLDPAHYQFRVHYRRGEPLTLDEWRNMLPDATLIINANFFSPEHEIQGLLIADGHVYGRSYRNRGGTFFVAGDRVGLQRNGFTEPDTTSWSQAIQAFPTLVYSGGQAYSNPSDTFPSRRTVIALDGQGRVIVMVTPGFGIGLHELSAYLSTSDMDLRQALNLDGGGSTMLYLAPSQMRISSFDPVPAVLALYAR